MNIEEKYEKVLNIFKELSRVPRNSTKEEKIADYICQFAKERGLEYRKDELYNVIVKKGATPGYENKKTILFQAHIDMVCEKTADSTHDFENDPIEIIESEETYTAKDTTLGADDGIGVAFLLLLLDDEDIPHPAIECLFTTQEEIGMDGARNFNYGDLKASYLINLDGEEENTAIVGCAGGIRMRYTKEMDLEEKKNVNVYKLSITGLYGGHSGVDIDKGRINSNLLAATYLETLENIQIASFVGGNKDNAIANATEVVFTTEDKEANEKLQNFFEKLEVTDADKNLKMELVIQENKTMKVMSREDSNELIRLFLDLKQNVIAMSKDVEGLVETSGNIGIAKIQNGKALICEALRSSIDSDKVEVMNYNNNIAEKLGFEILGEGDYPGWKYNPNSKLEKVYVNSYKKSHNGEEPIVCAIHAGVECGMIYEKMPHLEMISLGPDVVDVHTVNEKLYIKSCKTLLETLMYMIEELD